MQDPIGTIDLDNGLPEIRVGNVPDDASISYQSDRIRPGSAVGIGRLGHLDLVVGGCRVYVCPYSVPVPIAVTHQPPLVGKTERRRAVGVVDRGDFRGFCRMRRIGRGITPHRT